MPVEKILVVEDSDLRHQMYEVALSRYKASGARILHAHNGREALAVLSRHPDSSLRRKRRLDTRGRQRIGE